MGCRRDKSGVGPHRIAAVNRHGEVSTIYRLLRRLLFLQDPEDVHHTALRLLEWVGRHPSAARYLVGGGTRDAARFRDRLACERWGIRFPGPVGVAAGFDKDGVAIRGLAAIGFHFVEAGTVTPRPQEGNPRPRLFRLPEEEALVNRLGFNNRGADALRRQLEDFSAELTAAQPSAPSSPGGGAIRVGVNIGKNRDTPLERAVDDYVACLRAVYPLGDYYAINLSSPNTPGLRQLQTGTYVTELLGAVREELDRLRTANNGTAHGGPDASTSPNPPLLLKIAPDLPARDLEHVLQAALDSRLSGLIVANTWPHPAGGLSGRPLRDHGHRLVAAVRRRVGSALPIIGVGGIMTAADAYARIRAGASLVQVYTGFVYGGPRTPTTLAAGLGAMLERDGFAHLDEAVGIDADRWPEPWPAPVRVPAGVPTP